MSISAPYDARGVANLVLDMAIDCDLDIGHVKLQKVLYFVHAIYIIETGKPLIRGYFEAWTYGPVHPDVYRTFKIAGPSFIKFRAQSENIITGTKSLIESPTEPKVKMICMRVLSTLGQMNDFDLVKLSHAPGGPWAVAVESIKTGLAVGARIGNDVICERFARHRIALSDQLAGKGSRSAAIEEAPLGKDIQIVTSYRAGK
jgi:uncharacterized phage-associated protein